MLCTGRYSVHQEDYQEAEGTDGSGAEGHVAIQHTQGYILYSIVFFQCSGGPDLYFLGHRSDP